MRLVLRTAAMATVFALLAGPFDPANWPLGGVLSAPLALATGELRPLSPARAARVLLAPWFLLGVVLGTLSGAARLTWLLLVTRDWDSVDFIRCPSPARTGHGRTLHALAETVSPGSIVVAEEDDRLLISVIGADQPEKQGRAMQTWHRRFWRPLTG